MSRLVSFGVLVAILVVIGVMFYQVMASFILPLFLATLLVVIFHPLHRWILQRCGQRTYLAAVLTTLSVLMIVLAPAIGVFTFAVIEAGSAVTQINVEKVRDRWHETKVSTGLEIPEANRWRALESQLTAALLVGIDDSDKDAKRSARKPVPVDAGKHFDDLISALASQKIVPDETQIKTVRERLADLQAIEPGTIDYDGAVQEALQALRELKQTTLGGPLSAAIKELANPSDEQLRKTLGSGLKYGQDWLVSIAGDTTAFAGKLLIGLAIMIVAMFFFFADGPKMIEQVMKLTPLDPTYERELLSEFDRVSRAVVVATLLSAVVQGTLAGIGYFFAGLESVFLLMLLTTVLAMVPMVGTSLVWVPACLWLYLYEGRPYAALFLFLYSLLVVSQIDNVIKPWVLHGQSRLHPLAALLSVLGGVQALGPIGILVGPMVVVFLATLLKILQRELSRIERLPWATDRQ